MSVPIRTDQLSALLLRPTSGSAFELTVEQLATAIRLGAFRDGDLLPPERELAERLAVSRSTLREAIAALRDAGLVTTRRGRGGGTMVTYAGETPGAGGPEAELSAAAIADVLDFRQVVEPGAAGLAATRTLSANQRAWLLSCAAQVREAPDPAAYQVNDSRLHLALATLSDCPMLLEAVTRAQAALHELLRGIPVVSRNVARSHDQHDAIVAAVLAGDSETARVAMSEHCEDTSTLLRALLRPRG